MTITLTITGAAEARLKAMAERKGVSPERVLLDFVQKGEPEESGDVAGSSIPPGRQGERGVNEVAMTPEEHAAAQQELEQFMRNMNENRRESEGARARVPYPWIDE